MLGGAAIRQAACVSCKKREGVLLVLLVLGEMEGDPPYEPPQGIFRVQIRPHALPLSACLGSDSLVQLEPSNPQRFCVEVLQASHERSLEGQCRQVFLARWRNQLCVLREFGVAYMAKLGEVPLRKCASEDKCWSQRGLDLDSREV